MEPMDVSRDNHFRSRPNTMASLFPHRPDFELVARRLQEALSSHFEEMVDPTAGSMPHSGASSSSAAPAKPNPQQMFEKKKIFQAGFQVLDAAMQEPGPTPTEQHSTSWTPGAGKKVFGPMDIVAGECPCAKGLKIPTVVDTELRH